MLGGHDLGKFGPTANRCNGSVEVRDGFIGVALSAGLAVVVSGSNGAGKTTIAKQVYQRRSGRWASFKNYARSDQISRLPAAWTDLGVPGWHGVISNTPVGSVIVLDDIPVQDPMMSDVLSMIAATCKASSVGLLVTSACGPSIRLSSDLWQEIPAPAMDITEVLSLLNALGAPSGTEAGMIATNYCQDNRRTPRSGCSECTTCKTVRMGCEPGQAT